MLSKQHLSIKKLIKFRYFKLLDFNCFKLTNWLFFNTKFLLNKLNFLIVIPQQFKTILLWFILKNFFLLKEKHLNDQLPE